MNIEVTEEGAKMIWLALLMASTTGSPFNKPENYYALSVEIIKKIKQKRLKTGGMYDNNE